MGKDRTGKSLEQAVTRIQQLMAPGATIERGVRIQNRLGIPREFDVTVRGEFAGHQMLGVIECKDWADKVGTPELDAFIQKSSDINANFRLIVSPKGFTGPALIQAKDAGVGVYSLLPEPGADVDFSVAVRWYGRAYFWDQRQMELSFFPGKSPPAGWSEGDVCLDGKRIFNWFVNELSTTYGQRKELGRLSLSRKLDPPLNLTIRNEHFAIPEIEFSALRTCRHKARFMQISGDALLNWDTKAVSFPQEGAIKVHNIDPSLTDWEDHEGEFPPLGRYQCIIDRFWAYNDADASQIPHLGKVSEWRSSGPG
jgi:hypothetical protein